MKAKYLVYILPFLLINCNTNNSPQPDTNSEIEKLTEKENASDKDEYKDGILAGSFAFEVKTDDVEMEDGIIPWASIEKPEEDLPNLINGDDIIIKDKKITVIIDYPLTNEYHFNLESNNGFSRKMLLTEISKHYYKLYKEEEETATIKTLPMDKRTIANRNETNGKYGIWGHDIADLVLTDIYFYKSDDGKIILRMDIES
ncbi:hypothetical protein AM493_02785 [Flavobacterium akiainvivens]|uniref:Uncharacterized protein n=1 Tax=Flavobacterium akiainvivens TaxID=1202724 RepID=A0A0M8MG58_9FLAO|nr:hypothetical protein [Flavobacterium akiainvivens]KOS05077.1 hypothetical protein AM493_02785 [Flavobacterium akiainvivens]SFQ51868.1 hypothetical protein SAMN05444144_106247 [Flavobacterium akiainvivens]